MIIMNEESIKTLTDAIDGALLQGNVLLAVDGRCASGKTTLANRLQSIYDCNVFHMDDFFLRPEQRTADRLARPGENVDHERFLSEVLIPASEGKPVFYRPYNCHTGLVEEGRTIQPQRLSVIEGSYSLHPSLSPYYTLKAFIHISPETRKKRIEIRNTPQMAAKFFSTWIPLEERYFEMLDISSQKGVIHIEGEK